MVLQTLLNEWVLAGASQNIHANTPLDNSNLERYRKFLFGTHRVRSLRRQEWGTVLVVRAADSPN